MGIVLHPAQYVTSDFLTLLGPADPLRVLEHGSATHRQMALEHLVTGLLDFATHEQGTKSITKALKEGGKETLDRIIARMCEQSKGYATNQSEPTLFHALIRRPSGRRAIIVDLALSVAGSQLIATVLPNVRGYALSRNFDTYSFLPAG
jgi:pumilio RNA-binding family